MHPKQNSFFDTIGYTEKPDEVAAKLFEGRIAIIVDGTPFVITAPYFFLEKKRCFANKDILFYAVLKNIILIILLYKFITTRYSLDTTLVNMIIVIILCSINPFSVTAYSSDPYINQLVLTTPIDSYKIFQSKVRMSFFLNSTIVLIFILYIQKRIFFF